MSEHELSVYDEHLTEEQIEQVEDTVGHDMQCVTILFSEDTNIPLKLRKDGRTKVASLDVDWKTEWEQIGSDV